MIGAILKVIKIADQCPDSSRWEKVVAVKRKMHPAPQIAAVVKQADMGMPVADLIQQTGIME